MKSESWDEYVDTIATGLRGLEATDRSGASLPPREAVTQWVTLTREVHDRDGQLFLFGNGGSAAMAAHMATDACKNGNLRAHRVQRRRDAHRHQQRPLVRSGVFAAARAAGAQGRPRDRDQQFRQLAERRPRARSRARSWA